MPKRKMNDDEVGILVAVAGVIMIALWLLAMAGCTFMPERIIVRGPDGNVLATANPDSGEIVLTRLGVHLMQPKIIFPGQK
jgi:hypothetical protein